MATAAPAAYRKGGVIVTTRIEALAGRIAKLQQELPRQMQRVIDDIAAHPRHSEKLDVMLSLTAEAERLTRDLELLAEMHRLNPASLIGQLPTKIVPRTED